MFWRQWEKFRIIQWASWIDTMDCTSDRFELDQNQQQSSAEVSVSFFMFLRINYQQDY